MYMITNEIMFDDRVMSRKDFLISCALFRYSERANMLKLRHCQNKGKRNKGDSTHQKSSDCSACKII